VNQPFDRHKKPLQKGFLRPEHFADIRLRFVRAAAALQLTIAPG